MKNSKINLADKFPVSYIKFVKANPFAFLKMNAKELKKKLNYVGLIATVKAELSKIENEIIVLQYAKIKDRNWKSYNYGIQKHILTIKNRIAKNAETERKIITFKKEFEQNIKLAFQPCLYKQFTYGVYNASIRNFKIDDSTIATISWKIDSDWNYYAKSYGKPKNTTSDRCVIFKKYNENATKYDQTIYSIDSFAGNFLEKAISDFYNTTEIKVDKNLKNIQLNSVFTVEKKRSIGGVNIYIRKIGEVFWDFCAQVNDTTYHASSELKSIKMLRDKLRKKTEDESNRIQQELTLLNAQVCKDKYGFCDAGLRSFCELNNLNFDSQYTIQQVRKEVVKRREENCFRYVAELKTVGIVLNCK